MIIKYDANDNGENLSRRDDEWDNMLLELFDHSVDKDLPDRSKTRQQNNVTQKRRIVICKLVRALQLTRSKRINPA